MIHRVFTSQLGAFVTEEMDDEFWLNEEESKNSKTVAYLVLSLFLNK